jgi:uncharacterized protein YndB with AHSA1/START domain
MTHDNEYTENPVRLTRVLDAPRDEVWRMWTDPAEFAAWYGPDGAIVEVTQWDLHPGGVRRVVMGVETPRGPMTMRFTGEFVEVTEPERLVYTETMADQAHPETRVEVHLRENGERTTVELTHHGIPAGSPGEAGWAMALDHLAARVLSA